MFYLLAPISTFSTLIVIEIFGFVEELFTGWANSFGSSRLYTVNYSVYCTLLKKLSLLSFTHGQKAKSIPYNDRKYLGKTCNSQKENYDLQITQTTIFNF